VRWDVVVPSFPSPLQGKQTPIFLHPIAADVLPAKCISLLDKRGTLDLESDTTEQLSSFLFGLQSLLNKGGRDVLVDTKAEQEAAAVAAAAAAAPAPASGAASTSSSSSSLGVPPAAGRGKRFSIMTANPTAAELEKSRYGNFKRALLAIPENENLRVMCEGRDFYVWQVDDTTGRVSKKLQHVYYVTQAQSGTAQPLRLGAFYYNDVGRKETNPTRRFVIGELSDVFVGKQTAILTDPAAAGANPKCCVTFVTSQGAQLNLEALAAEQCNTFLSGINAILTGNGLTVLLEESKSVSETGKVGKKTKRFSIMAPTPLPGVNMADPRAVAVAGSAGTTIDGVQTPKQRQTMLGVATHEAIATMSEGRRFTRYFHSATGVVNKEIITLFYVKESHTLFWSQPGTRIQSESASMKFDQLSDVFLVRSHASWIGRVVADLRIGDAPACRVHAHLLPCPSRVVLSPLSSLARVLFCLVVSCVVRFLSCLFSRLPGQADSVSPESVRFVGSEQQVSLATHASEAVPRPRGRHRRATLRVAIRYSDRTQQEWKAVLRRYRHDE
jgi:hypothetical protein